MAVLVDYACTGCGGRAEHWVGQPIPSRRICACCGLEASRRFGLSLVMGSAPRRSAALPNQGRSQHTHDVPGACTLTDTAARMLSARARGDSRALDGEISFQESAIKGGLLDPSSSVVTTFPGGPAAAAIKTPCPGA